MAITRRSRKELQELFENILDSKNVYYRPPESIKMKYPAIVYNMDSSSIVYADDKPYTVKTRYTVTLIEKEADSKYLDKLLDSIPYCNHVSNYKSDGLEHNRLELQW